MQKHAFLANSGFESPETTFSFGILLESVKLEKCYLDAFKDRNGKEYMFSIK